MSLVGRSINLPPGAAAKFESRGKIAFFIAHWAIYFAAYPMTLNYQYPGIMAISWTLLNMHILNSMAFNIIEALLGTAGLMEYQRAMVMEQQMVHQPIDGLTRY